MPGFSLTVGQTYYMLTFADTGMTMPGLDPLIYLGDTDDGASHVFQDTVSYTRFGSRLEMDHDPEDICAYFIAPDEIGSSIVTLAQAAEQVAAAVQRALDLGHPVLPVLRTGWSN